MQPKTAFIITPPIIILIIIPFIIILLSMTVSAAENFNLAASRASIPVCPCTSAEDTLLLQNMNAGETSATFIVDGTVKESRAVTSTPSTYSIQTSGDASSFTATVPSLLTVEAGASAEIKNIITAPCDAKGNIGLTTTATTSEGLAKELRQEVIVGECTTIQLEPIVAQQQTCPCTPAVFSFTLKNIGTFTDTYTISVSDELADSITLSQNPVTLAPQQMQTIYLYVNAACSVYGGYEIPIAVISTSTKQSSELQLELNLQQECYDYDVKVGKAIVPGNASQPFQEYSGLYEICENELQTIPVLVTHPSNISNTYLVKLGGDEMASLDVNEFSLSRNQQTFVQILLHPPEGFNATEALDLSITTAQGDFAKRGALYVKAESCYLPEVEESTAAINYSGTISFFSVTNRGTKPAKYKLSIEGEEWIKPATNLVEFKRGESKKIGITTTPPASAEEGNYEARILLEADNGVVYERSIFFKLRKSAGIPLLLPLLTGLAALLVLAGVFFYLSKKRRLQPTAKSAKRRKKINWNVWLYAGLGVLAAALIVLAVVYSEAILPWLDANKTLDVTKPLIIAKAEEKAPAADPLASIKSLAAKIPYGNYVLIGIGALAVLVIIIEIARRWKKRKKEVFEVPAEPAKEIVKEAAKKPAIIKEAKASALKEAAPKPQEGQEGIQHWKLYLSIIILFILAAVAYLFSGEISAYIPALNVTSNATSMKSLASTAFAGATTTLQRLISGGGYAIWVAAGIAALILIIGISEFIRRRKKKIAAGGEIIVVGKKEPAKEAAERTVEEKKEAEKTITKKAIAEKKRTEKKAKKEEITAEKPWKAILLPLCMLILLLGGILAYRSFVLPSALLLQQPDEQPAAKGPAANASQATVPAAKEPIATKPAIQEPVNCTLTLQQNTPSTLNLSQAFSDPDMDILSFSSTKPNNIDVEISDGRVVLTPHEGFAGVEHAVFNAADNKGGKASSGMMAICVKKSLFPGFNKAVARARGFGGKAAAAIGNYLKANGMYALAGIVILIVLMLLIKYRKPLLNFLEEEEKPAKRKR